MPAASTTTTVAAHAAIIQRIPERLLSNAALRPGAGSMPGPKTSIPNIVIASSHASASISATKFPLQRLYVCGEPSMRYYFDIFTGDHWRATTAGGIVRVMAPHVVTRSWR